MTPNEHDSRPRPVRPHLGAGTQPSFLVLAAAFVTGILFWGGFNTAMEYTNREEFCISCHEMKDNVYAEYRNTIHYQTAPACAPPARLPCAPRNGGTR